MESVPLMKPSSLAEDILVKTREASQNTDLDMWEILWIHKALQPIYQGKLVNITLKLTRIDKRIKIHSKKWKEVEVSPTCYEEKRQPYRYMLEVLSTDWQARLNILSNTKNFFERRLQGWKKQLKSFLMKINLTVLTLEIDWHDYAISTCDYLNQFSSLIFGYHLNPKKGFWVGISNSWFGYLIHPRFPLEAFPFCFSSHSMPCINLEYLWFLDFGLFIAVTPPNKLIIIKCSYHFFVFNRKIRN